MDLLVSVLAALLFSTACNLDTIMLSMGYAARGIHTPGRASLVIAAVTTLVTWFSLELGEAAARFLPRGISALLGSLVLVGIGAWFLLDALRLMGQEGSPAQLKQLSGLRACVSLAAALAVNNAGAGVAAGVSGISPVWAAVCNFLVTVLFLPLGRWLGTGPLGRRLGPLALPLSGALLVLLGILELLV